MDHDIDLEAQQRVLSQAPGASSSLFLRWHVLIVLDKETGASEIHESSPSSEKKSGASGAEPVSTGQQVDSESPLAISQAAGGAVYPPSLLHGF